MVKYIFLFLITLTVNVVADAAPLADPTKPLAYKSKPVYKQQRAALPKLQSILAKGKQWRAIINNKLYTSGERVNGYLITRIEKDVVYLRNKSSSYKLTLYTKKERFIKQTR